MLPLLKDEEPDEIGKTAGKMRPAHVDSPEDTVSRVFLAALFGVDVRSIKNFADEGMPKAARGQFVLAAAVQWYLEREREHARGSKGLNDLDLARQRKTVAEARMAEIDLSDRTGASIPTSVHEERLRARLETVAGSIKSLGRYQPDIKAALTDEQADALLDRMMDETLAELHGLTDTIE